MRCRVRLGISHVAGNEGLLDAVLIGLFEKTVFFNGTVQLAAMNVVELLSERPFCVGVVDEELEVWWDAMRDQQLSDDDDGQVISLLGRLNRAQIDTNHLGRGMLVG